MSKHPAANASQIPRPLAPEPESFVHALLAAQDIATLAAGAVRQLQTLGLRQVQLLWNHEPSPQAPIHSSDGTAPDAATVSLLEAARRQGGRAQRNEPDGQVHAVFTGGSSLDPSGVVTRPALIMWPKILFRPAASP